MSDEYGVNVPRRMALSDRLERAPMVLRRAEDSSGSRRIVGEIATEAADSLLDIEGSAATIFRELLPALESLQPDSPEFEDMLLEIAEEWRHIAYHILNTELFAYVIPERRTH